MQKVMTVLAVCAIGGCAWHDPNYILYAGDPLPADQEVVVTSVVDQATAARLTETFGFEPTVPRLIQADDQRSPGSAMAMNSMYDGAFEVRMKPGVHTVTVLPGIDVYAPSGTAITFAGEAGHRYFLGEIRTKPDGFQFIKDTTFRWQPILVDMTSGAIVYPPNPRKMVHAEDDGKMVRAEDGS